MSDFATLTIQRRLTQTGKDQPFWDLISGLRNGIKLERLIETNRLDPSEFGTFHYQQNQYGMYVTQLHKDEEKNASRQLRIENEIASEWLMCFSFQEMEVIGFGSGMGVFQAGTLVEEAIERLTWAEVGDYDLFTKRNELKQWLEQNAKPDDFLFVCSNWMFYHDELKYDEAFVRNYINNRIATLKKSVHCLQWKKKYERPIQMTA